MRQKAGFKGDLVTQKAELLHPCQNLRKRLMFLASARPLQEFVVSLVIQVFRATAIIHGRAIGENAGFDPRGRLRGQVIHEQLEVVPVAQNVILGQIEAGDNSAGPLREFVAVDQLHMTG